MREIGNYAKFVPEAENFGSLETSQILQPDRRPDRPDVNARNSPEAGNTEVSRLPGSPRSKSAEFGTRRSKIAEIGTPSRTLSGFAAGSFRLLLLPHGLLWVARSRWVVSFAFTSLAACQDGAQDVEIAPKVSQTQQPSLSTDDVAENPDKNACRSTS